MDSSSSSKIYEVKSAVGRTKQKISSLQSDIDEKDAALENETGIRLAVEKQNKELKNKLVDMYKANPKVNEELRGRLPAARQHLSKKLEKEECAASFEDFCMGLGVLEASSKDLEQKSDTLPEQTSSEAHMESWSKDDVTKSSNNKEDGSVSEQNVTINLHLKLHEPVSQVMPDTVQQPSQPLPNPRSLHGATITSNICTDYARTTGSSKSMEEYFPEYSEQSEPASSFLEGGRQSTSTYMDQCDTFLHKAQVPAIRPVPPKNYGPLTNTASQNQRVSESQVTSQPHVPLTAGQFFAVIDKEKNIAFLLKELDAMRDTNKKLQEKLCEKDRQLETLKLDLDLQEKAIEAKIAEKAAALVEEVYNAQRERDAAVMARLRLANEERDEALLRVKRLEQAVEELENINPEENDMTLQELLHRINNAESGLAIEKNGAVIVDRIHKTKERKQKITAEEMNAVIEERDTALSRCKRLEQELHRLKEQSQTSANNARHLTAANNQERALKAHLSAMAQERDQAIQQCKKLEEEMQKLRVYYSLHNSLSQEASLKEQFTSALSSYEDAIRSKDGFMSVAHHQNEELGTQLQLALTERAEMEVKLQEAVEATKEANEKVQKLERLVDVLRKKVGAGTVRTVI